MAAISAYAPGKIILFGEHAVVYGRRAIAIPIEQVQARAAVFPLIKDPPGTIQVTSADIHLDAEIHSLPLDHPIRKAVEGCLLVMGIPRPPAILVRISSTIPIAGGMGSGAAVSVALARAISTYLGKPLAREDLSAIAFDVEKIHHGTPSGIDNTVIAFNTPVLFQKEQPITQFEINGPFTFLIASTGIRASTAEVVAGVRERWQKNTAEYDTLFDQIDSLVVQAVQSLRAGDCEFVGRWMTENHHLLRRMGVSSTNLDRLVDSACAAGAYGAKLSGAGVGGNVIVLTPPEKAEEIQQILLQVGAIRVIQNVLEGRPCNSSS